MGDLNKLFLTGVLVEDPKVENTGGGSRVASFSVKSTRKFKKADNSHGTEEIVVDCCAYAKCADEVALAKEGSQVAMIGRMRAPRGADLDVEFPPLEFVVEDFQQQGA